MPTPESAGLRGAAGLEDLVTGRYSCRAFLNSPVPASDVDRMFALAQRTPSWCNTQPWDVTLVEGEDVRRLAGALLQHTQRGPEGWDFAPPAGYRGIYADRRRAAGHALYDAAGIYCGDASARLEQGMRNFEFFGAPHVAFITSAAELGTYGAVDTGAYIMTLLLAARDLGLAAIPQAGVARHADWLRATLGMGNDRRLVAAVSFGLPDPDNPVNTFRTEREGELASVVRRRRV